MIFLLKHDQDIDGECRGNYFYCVARKKENFIAYSFHLQRSIFFAIINFPTLTVTHLSVVEYWGFVVELVIKL